MNRWLLLPFAAFLIVLPFPHTVAARLLLLTTCAVIAAWQWRKVPDARATVPCKGALLAWAAVSVGSLFYTVDLGYSMGELKNEVGYSMLAFLAFFVAGRDEESTLWLVRATALGTLILGTWAISSWVVHDFAWQEGGGHGGIGIVATYIVTVVPAIAWLALSEGDARGRRAAVGIGILAVGIAFVAGQRAVWPVLVVQAFLGLWLVRRTRLMPLGAVRLAAMAGLALSVAWMGMAYSQAFRFKEHTDIRVQPAHDVRLGFWPKVVEKIAEQPMVGSGFGRNMMKKAHPELIPPDWTSLWHAHNVLLNYGLQLGVPGPVVLLGLFGAFAAFYWPRVGGSRAAAAAGIAGVGVIVGVFLRNQFNDFFLRDMSLLFWALTGLFARRVIAERDSSVSPR